MPQVWPLHNTKCFRRFNVSAEAPASLAPMKVPTTKAPFSMSHIIAVAPWPSWLLMKSKNYLSGMRYLLSFSPL